MCRRHLSHQPIPSPMHRITLRIGPAFAVVVTHRIRHRHTSRIPLTPPARLIPPAPCFSLSVMDKAFIFKMIAVSPTGRRYCNAMLMGAWTSDNTVLALPATLWDCRLRASAAASRCHGCEGASSGRDLPLRSPTGTPNGALPVALPINELKREVPSWCTCKR